MSDTQFKYDVAFSFLQQDEPLVAQVNDLLQDRIKTFFYPKQQRELAGTDGEQTFNRVFAEEARMVVVFYRSNWGETSWTRIEQTAIRNRGHEHGYDFAKFIPLDMPSTVPKWLPKSHIYIGLKRFGIESTAAVIEARVQELGGLTHEETVEEHAQRLERRMRFDERREKFQWEVGVAAAQREVANLKVAMEESAAAVRRSSTLIPLSIVQDWQTVYIVGLGRALGVNWKQASSNHLGNAVLRAVLYTHKPAGPGHMNFEDPSVVESMRFRFDLLPSEEGGWFSEETQRTFSTLELSDFLTKYYLKKGRH